MTSLLRRLAPASFLALALTTACSAPSSSEEDDASTSDEVKKRTSPRGDSAGVLLEKPAWLAPSFLAAVTARGATGSVELVPGVLTDVVPGATTLTLQTEGGLGAYAFGRGVPLRSGTIAKGEVWKTSLAGLRLALARPVVWPRPIRWEVSTAPTPSMARGFGVSEAIFGDGATRADRLLPEGTYQLAVGTSSPRTLTLTAGKLLTIDVPMVTFAVDLDPVDPAYPDGEPTCVTLVADTYVEPVRALRSLANAVLPADYDVRVEVYGNHPGESPSVVASTSGFVRAGVRHFPLNRLELAPMRVTTDQGVEIAHGEAQIQIATPRGWAQLTNRFGNGARFRTGTGVDLPNGSYRVVTTATATSGTRTDVQEITLP